MNLFSGRKLLIVTKHGKEAVIAPHLSAALGVECVTSDGFDTDTLGTFSGEIERRKDALNTLREKCLLGMSLYNCDLAVASEGSFGSHPAAFFAAAGDELVMMVDTKNNLEIIAREFTLQTNFHAERLDNQTDFLRFLKAVGFPKHAVIIKRAEDDLSDMVKGVVDPEQALTAFRRFRDESGSAFVETDMRACFNPTRMKAIELAVQKLVEKVQSLCPDCSMPGFGVTSQVAGLPCELCRNATGSVLYHVYTCQKCSYKEDRYYPRGITYEDPAFCDFCNP